MAKQELDRGTIAGDGTGEVLYDAFGKVINNFDELYLLAISSPLNNQAGSTYNILLSDAGRMVTMNHSSANSIVLPANSSVAFPVETEIGFMQLGDGSTSITIAGDLLRVNAALTPVLNGKYAVACAKKVAATEWVLFGNLVPA